MGIRLFIDQKWEFGHSETKNRDLIFIRKKWGFCYSYTQKLGFGYA
jgi:hypothetical protein